MKPFNRNKALVAGIVVSSNFNQQNDRTYLWLRQDQLNGKTNFVEVSLKGNQPNVEIGIWLLIQGRIEKEGHKTVIKAMSEYDILGCLAGGTADVQMNQYELAGNIGKIEHNDKGWTNISLAVKNWDKNAQPQETTAWCNLNVKTETISKLGLTKGTWLFVDCNCSTNKYRDNTSGADRVAYNFYVNRIVGHNASGNRTSSAAGGAQQGLPARHQNAPQAGSFGVPQEASSGAPSM